MGHLSGVSGVDGQPYSVFHQLVQCCWWDGLQEPRKATWKVKKNLKPASLYFQTRGGEAETDTDDSLQQSRPDGQAGTNGFWGFDRGNWGVGGRSLKMSTVGRYRSIRRLFWDMYSPRCSNGPGRQNGLDSLLPWKSTGNGVPTRYVTTYLRYLTSPRTEWKGRVQSYAQFQHKVSTQCDATDTRKQSSRTAFLPARSSLGITLLRTNTPHCRFVQFGWLRFPCQDVPTLLPYLLLCANLSASASCRLQYSAAWSISLATGSSQTGAYWLHWPSIT